jgi:hypothetical protein
VKELVAAVAWDTVLGDEVFQGRAVHGLEVHAVLGGADGMGRSFDIGHIGLANAAKEPDVSGERVLAPELSEKVTNDPQ